jgi:hypothetical protein
MTNFKDRLWQELVREHGAALSEAEKPRRRARPRLLAGTTVSLVAVGTATALVLGAASSSPAFAVNRDRDGTIAVTIKAIGGIRGANARLAQIGVPARAVEVAPGCPARVPPAAFRKAVAGLAHMGVARGSIHAAVTARFDPRKIPPGRMLLVPVVPRWKAGGHVQVVPGRVVRGRPPACLPFAPPPVPGAPGLPPGARGVQCLAGPPPGAVKGRRPLPAGPPRLVRCRAAGRVVQCVAGPPHPGKPPHQVKP